MKNASTIKILQKHLKQIVPEVNDSGLLVIGAIISVAVINKDGSVDVITQPAIQHEMSSEKDGKSVDPIESIYDIVQDSLNRDLEEIRSGKITHSLGEIFE